MHGMLRQGWCRDGIGFCHPIFFQTPSARHSNTHHAGNSTAPAGLDFLFYVCAALFCIPVGFGFTLGLDILCHTQHAVQPCPADDWHAVWTLNEVYAHGAQRGCLRSAVALPGQILQLVTREESLRAGLQWYGRLAAGHFFTTLPPKIF